MTFEQTYVDPRGRTAQKDYIPALAVALLAFGFYKVVSNVGLNGQWVMTTLLFPGFVLTARRLHDMGQTAKLLLIPLALDVVALGWHYADALKIRPGAPPDALLWAAVVVSAAFVVWALVGKAKDEGNRYGAAA
jgi:uncharacterized membrane protein YhaH (DUF805 family)